LGEGFGRGFEQRSARIATRAMRQDEAVASATGRLMQKSADDAGGIWDSFVIRSVRHSRIRYTGEFGFRLSGR
jgi:hypothetical protein